MTWDNSETLSTVLHFDPVHFRISGKTLLKKVRHLHLIFQGRMMSDVMKNYLDTFGTNDFGSPDDPADLCTVSCPLRNIGQDTDCPNEEYL